jgi:DNA-binding NtrC family response regulator
MAYVQIIDDDPLIRDSLTEYLEIEGYEVSAYSTAEDALNVLSKELPDIVLLDLKLPGMDGIQCLEQIKQQFPEIEVIMITGYANVDTAVKAMKLGAWDYIKKPFELEELSLVVRKAVESRQKNEQLSYLRKDKEFGFGEIIGSCEQIKEVFDFIRRVAHSPRTSVLIRGETGTGKELVAKAIHYNGPRANKPFIEVNCSAFQESLLESELFGYEAGAFTGARQRKKGLLELANEGTFFLDEIGDMSFELQAKILKVIEEQTYRRVGGTKEIKIDTRIVSASSRDLVQLVSDGTFRQDLFYRLNVATIVLPPLRERGDDVILLAEHFLNLFNAEFKRNIKGLTSEAKLILQQHSWPGNVRELRNVIERAVLFATGDYLTREDISLIQVPHAPTATGTDFTQLDIPDSGLSLQEVERVLIQKALRKTNGNQTQAARLLGISREKLKYRMKKLQIQGNG